MRELGERMSTPPPPSFTTLVSFQQVVVGVARVVVIAPAAGQMQLDALAVGARNARPLRDSGWRIVAMQSEVQPAGESATRSIRTTGCTSGRRGPNAAGRGTIGGRK